MTAEEAHAEAKRQFDLAESRARWRARNRVRHNVRTAPPYDLNHALWVVLVAGEAAQELIARRLGPAQEQEPQEIGDGYVITARRR